MDIYSVANQMKLERKTIFDLDLRVTYYARVSTTREEQDTSIDNQIQYFEELIQGNKNWTYVQGYADRIRGENAKNREHFQEMIQDGYDGKFDLILTKEVSRFARNTVDSLTYTRELLRHGVGVFFQNDNICTIDTDSELRLTIMSSIALDEVRKLSERIKFGHKKSIENGNVLGNSRIFGYTKQDNKLIIDGKQAEMVRLIFELYATGDYSVRKIEDILYEKGYRNTKGKKLYHTTISEIIQNPKYKGYYCGNKVKIVDYRTKEQKFLPQEEWVMYKDETGQVVPQIVSEELWDRANEIFKQRSDKVKQAGRSPKASSILSGKIVCGIHNTSFWRTSYSERLHKNKPIYQWICGEKKRQRNYSVCPTFAIYEKELYKILADVILSIYKTKDADIDILVKIVKEEMSDNKNNTQKELALVSNEIKKLEKKKDKLLDLYTDEIISKQEFKQSNDKLSVEISELKTKQSSLQATINTDVPQQIINTIHRLKEIANIDFDNLVSDGNINKEFVDNICKDLLDKIVVNSVDENSMQLDVYLNCGIERKYQYSRKNIRSSDHIFLKMCPELRTRISRKMGHKTVFKTYVINIYI